MKSYLKKIYESKKGKNLLTSPNYYLLDNPFYQVNEFITNINPSLCSNFEKNISDLIIKNNSPIDILSDYDYKHNILVAKDAKGDVFGLLNVASNNRDRKYTGVITEDRLGNGLNSGITEAFARDINGKIFNYPFESVIANAILYIDYELVSSSYFENDSNKLLSMSNDIKELLKYLDEYHNINFELMALKSEFFSKNLIRFPKTFSKEDELINLSVNIRKYEEINQDNVFHIFSSLIRIINSSDMKIQDKNELFNQLYLSFNKLFSNDKLDYLSEMEEEFEKQILVRRK